MKKVEDLEGTSFDDRFVGDNDSGGNKLLGRAGKDKLLGEGGPDTLFANDGESDTTLNCGDGGNDTVMRDQEPAGASSW